MFKMIFRNKDAVLFLFLQFCFSLFIFAQDTIDIEKGREHYIKAKECIDKNDSDNAMLHLEKAVDSGYTDPYACAMLASLFKLKNNNEKAKKYFNLAIENFKRDIEFYENKDEKEAVKYLRMDLEKAEQDLKSLM